MKGPGVVNRPFVVRRLSVRARLTALTVLGILTTFAVVGGTLFVVLQVLLNRAVDGGARSTARAVVQLIERNQLPPTLPAAGDALVQVVQGQSVLAASVGADRLTPLLDRTEVAAALRGEGLRVPGHRAGLAGTLRVVALPARMQSEPGGQPVQVSVLAGVPTTSLEDANARLALGLISTFPVIGVAVAALAWQVIGATLAPVERARTKQRTFVADAAHELRSPLASLRTQLEVAQRVGDGGELPAELLPDVARLSALVEDLLVLSRLEDEARPFTPARVDLAQVAREVADPGGAARVPVTVDADPSAVAVAGEVDGLRRVARNLVDNAVRHASTRVRVSVRRDGGHGVLQVCDDGSGIPPAQREVVFDRFTRLDEARDRDAGGSGLGLAIVADVVARHGGSVELGSAEFEPAELESAQVQSARSGGAGPGLLVRVRVPLWAGD